MPKKFYEIIDQHFLNAETMREGDVVGAALLDVAVMLNDISSIDYLKANGAKAEKNDERACTK